MAPKKKAFVAKPKAAPPKPPPAPTVTMTVSIKPTPSKPDDRTDAERQRDAAFAICRHFSAGDCLCQAKQYPKACAGMNQIALRVATIWGRQF